MAELKTKEEDVITADLASIPPKQPEGPKLVKGQEPETLDRAAAVRGVPSSQNQLLGGSRVARFLGSLAY